MPARTDLQSILVVGSGPIVIGQACEFDYSGTQAVRALRAEGYRVVLVNSNPATIMTDPDLADATYVEPITADVVAAVIAEEQPDALLPTLGGQTALNVTTELAGFGVLDRHRVELIGAGLDAIAAAEDRGRFKALMDAAGIATAAARSVTSVDGALAAAEKLGYPVMVRPSYILGGGGTGFAAGPAELRRVAGVGLDASPVGEVLVEESIAGWKEFELEVMRDVGRQRRGGVLDREPRPHGGPHRRLDHGGPGDDPVRPGVPGDEERGDRLPRAGRASPPAAPTSSSPSSPRPAAGWWWR